MSKLGASSGNITFSVKTYYRSSLFIIIGTLGSFLHFLASVLARRHDNVLDNVFGCQVLLCSLLSLFCFMCKNKAISHGLQCETIVAWTDNWYQVRILEWAYPASHETPATINHTWQIYLSCSLLSCILLLVFVGNDNVIAGFILNDKIMFIVLAGNVARYILRSTLSPFLFWK